MRRLAIIAILLVMRTASAADSDQSRGARISHWRPTVHPATRRPAASRSPADRRSPPPLGVIYGSNITPDPATGIGQWSEADFERALRKGIREDGDYLYPAMPYANYTKMTAEDMHALWDYVHSLPPVRNTVPKNKLPFPFNVRRGVLLWQSLVFKPGAFVPNAHESGEWNRGAYLVEVLGHCDQCHTPRNAAQGLRTKRELTGAEIEGWYAPNISTDSLSKLRDWSEQDLADFLNRDDARQYARSRADARGRA